MNGFERRLKAHFSTLIDVRSNRCAIRTKLELKVKLEILEFSNFWIKVSTSLLVLCMAYWGLLICTQCKALQWMSKIIISVHDDHHGKCSCHFFRQLSKKAYGMQQFPWLAGIRERKISHTFRLPLLWINAACSLLFTFELAFDVAYSFQCNHNELGGSSIKDVGNCFGFFYSPLFKREPKG